MQFWGVMAMAQKTRNKHLKASFKKYSRAIVRPLIGMTTWDLGGEFKN